ncbi:MAG: hypothetical protein WBE00_12765, partial [Phycisphaerae bacterium]
NAFVVAELRENLRRKVLVARRVLGPRADQIRKGLPKGAATVPQKRSDLIGTGRVFGVSHVARIKRSK